MPSSSVDIGRGHRTPQGCGNPLRLETKFLSNLNLIWVVQTAKQKYSAFQNNRSGLQPVSARATMRDVRAIVTERGAGCDGRCGVRCLHRTKTPQRTAKSCGPDAATLASSRLGGVPLATVAKKAAHRGEHEISHKTIARGKPGCLGCTCSSTPVLFFARGLRAQSAPGFPCALFGKRGTRTGKAQAKSRRENENLCLVQGRPRPRKYRKRELRIIA
jgi:hypothetical protein